MKTLKIHNPLSKQVNCENMKLVNLGRESLKY